MHTLHPLELTHVLNGWGPGGPDDELGWRELLPEWELFLEWLVANRQNRAEWVLLMAPSWQEFADGHQVGELVYGRVTKLVPFGAFVQVGDGIEGLVHISEMAVHHVEAPEQVVTPGEELWVKIIDIDLDRRRISLSIKQAAEGGVVAAEYQDQFGEHAYDEQGNYIGPEIPVEDETAESEGGDAAAEGEVAAEPVVEAEVVAEAPPEGDTTA